MSKDTVTLPRAEYEALIERLEDLEDAATLRDFKERGDRDETFPAELVNRLLDSGEHPLRVWRE